MPKKVVVIGAGIGGLATANMLAKAGYDVHVYEKNVQLGGRAGQRTTNGFTFDTGPSWYLMPRVFEQYFGLFNVNLNDELGIKKLIPAYKVHFESHAPMTVHGDVTKDAAQFEAIEKGAGERLKTYVKEGQEIYDMAIDHFLYTNFERPQELADRRILAAGGRMAKLLLTNIHSRVSSFVTAKPLQQILEYPMVFLGTSPFKAPAMYSLMSALDFNEGVFYPARGMYSIIEALVKIGEAQGVTYHLNAPATRITHEHGVATGIVVHGETITADIVVSNADLHFTETSLLDAPARSYPDAFWNKKESGISALLLYVGVKGKLPQLEHHNLFFVDKWRENFEAIYEDKKVPESASLYVSRTSATDPSTAPEGHENLFVLAPLPSGISLSSDDKKKLTERFLQQVATTIDEPDLADNIVTLETFGPDDFEESFNSWNGTALGMSHLLKQSAFWRIPNKSKKLQNLYYVGANTVPGIGLPMCLIGAELTYKRIAGIKTGGPMTAIEHMTGETT